VTLLIGKTDSEPFTLPDAVLTHTMAILAKKGAGKTYTAGVIAEEFAKAGLPFVVLDPVGVWWGMRSSKNGKQSGLPIVVFGGEHGDIPIERYMGTAIAEAIVRENVSCIIDLTELSKTAWRQFVRDFCRRLFEINKSPRHVFIEEATEFVPQTRRPELQEAYEAVERLVRLGRNRGLGCTLISQRSAQVAKDVLTQIDVLIALRTVGPLDRKALLDMFEDVLEVDELPLLEEFKTGIPKIPNGTAWIWSPEFLKAFARVEIRERETYHAGATPTFQTQRLVQAKPDVSALRKLLADAVPDEPQAKPNASQPRPAEKDDSVLKATRADLEDQIRLTDELRAQLQAEARKRADAEQEVSRLTKQTATAAKLRQALVEFLGSDGQAAGAAAVADAEEIVQMVLSRMPATNGHAVAVTPPDALRKKYLTAAADRLLGRLQGLSPDARTAFEYLAGQGVYRGVNRVSMALSGNDSGGQRNRWSKALQELASMGLASRGGSGRSEYQADARGYVANELAAHAATDQETADVVNTVLYQLTTKEAVT
jgi:uncharacterized protein